MAESLSERFALVDGLVGDQPEAWDLAGELPRDLLVELGAAGILCAEVPASFGGLGLTSGDNGALTAHVGRHCSSLRSIMTSQGIAAATIRRFGDKAQRSRFLGDLTGGRLAAVAFSEPDAGSDLSAMRTSVVSDGDSVVVTGEKKWTTGARYADLLIVLGLDANGVGAAVVVPPDTPGVHLDLVESPLGCRAAGHANLRLDEVRLPASHLLGGGGQALGMLFTTALSYGRMSVAWGCVGIIRACLDAATRHAATRTQGGLPLSDRQLISRHLADLLVAEQVSMQICANASRSWDSGSPDQAVAAVLAKHVSAGHAARGAATAVQVLASAGAQDGHVVARAYRDAKLMEIIEGSNEICQLILAEHALSLTR
ncbi:acyl-CoA dehydrogenase family protein [Streptomyces turgidiscabies]|uniref:Methoxymalonate biosynthesis protein n=1 Tax=Streptomyces turgidiscabies TaxID=85558 RepID=A0ABU0RXG4_9ACTN|nr:methoxymalonate biosynthesis protein [Streptomyces turgidiscabies]